MKQINVTFTDVEHATLLSAKGKKSWHDFVWVLSKMGDIQMAVENAPELSPTDASEYFAAEYFNWLTELRDAVNAPVW